MSRKRKYSNEFRVRVVQEYLSGKYGGFERLGKKYGKVGNTNTKDIRTV